MTAKRHVRMAIACGSTLAIAASTTSFWWPARVQAAALPRTQEQEWGALDAVAFSELETLRREVGADDDTLALLDLTQQQAQDLLGRLRTWYENNISSLHDAWKQDADQRAVARLTRSAAATGGEAPAPVNGSALATALADAANATFNGFTENQRTLISGMQARSSLPMPYRVLALSDEQKNALQAAITRHSLRATTAQAEGHSVEPLAAGPDLEQAIGANNLSTLQAFLARQAENARRIVAARNTVLPHAADVE